MDAEETELRHHSTISHENSGACWRCKASQQAELIQGTSVRGFAHDVVDNVEHAETSAAGELIVDEIQRPAGICLCFDEDRRTGEHVVIPVAFLFGNLGSPVNHQNTNGFMLQSVIDCLTTDEGRKLNLAFTRIHSLDVRHKLVDLATSLANVQ